MKSITFSSTLIGMLFLFCVACGTKKQEDSAEIAKETNDENIADRDEEKDADFIVNAVASNYAEIKLAQIALNKSNDTKVKEMATMLETDHSKILNELKSYADKHGITVPMEETADAREDMEKLAEKDTSNFDKEWCEMLEDKHEKSINKFEARLNKTEDAELKTWIEGTLPGLKSHLEMIKQHDDAE